MKISWTLVIIIGWIILIVPTSIESRFFPASAPAEITSVVVDSANP